jgi:site-specific DNA-methyltransferase (adenine-specific)
VPHKTAPKPKPLYRRKTAKAESTTKAQRREEETFHELPESHFKLQEDGSIEAEHGRDTLPRVHSESAAQPHRPPTNPEAVPTTPNLIFSHDSPFIRLYHADCLTLLDAIAAKYPQGRFDAIFADPPYFLSNGGITCHAGRMVKVDKGDWDKSRGPELNHEFNLEWLKRCRNVLKPNGTIWVSGTHHVIFSIGYAMQQLGFKILNDIAWEKPNPPPNLSCRYFTHSTETILWAARDEKSKHVFNYQDMRKVTGKQMKTVWKGLDLGGAGYQPALSGNLPDKESPAPGKLPAATGKLPVPPEELGSIWTMPAPGNAEKEHGKHPTQKPVALIERCLLASTNEGDLVLDPFLGGGTTAIAAIKLKRGCVGIELDFTHLTLAAKRADREIISIWLRHFRVTVGVVIYGRDTLPRVHSAQRAADSGRAGQSPDRRQEKVEAPATAANQGRATLSERAAQIDLDLFSNSINGSRVDDKPQMPTERIFHECKFVFLSCAEVERGAVVHTTVDVSLQEAWAKTPNGKKRETTHIVRCETEIFRVKQS